MVLDITLSNEKGQTLKQFNFKKVNWTSGFGYTHSGDPNNEHLNNGIIEERVKR